PSGSFFPIGTNVVRCCAVDRCNRTNCCEFLIVIHPKGNPCVKPPAGMVLWLPLDEPVGPMAANIIPGAPNGFHGGAPVPLLGSYVVNSLRFDGINDFVRVPNYAAIMLNASDLSIDAWVLREQPDQGRRVIVSKVGPIGGSANVRGYEYYLNNGVMNLVLGGVVAQNFNSGVIVPADGNWHHVAVTVRRPSGGLVQFYLDGALVNAQPGPIPLPLGNNSSLHVGAGTFPAPNNFFHGPIDEVEIFNRALTSAEVFALWNAHQAGKCKITCATPMTTPVSPGTCVTVNVQVCNNNALPQTISYVAQGAAIATPQSGTFVLAPFSCTNIPITLCSPAGTPPNSSLPWSFSVSSDAQCPMVCTGVVVNPGIIVIGPNDPTGITGTNQTSTVRLSLNGLPPGSPVRFTVIGPDMEPDTQYVSLNGLPPGVPWELPGASLAGKGGTKLVNGLDVPIRFTEEDPGGHYTILLEADLDGDGEYEPLSSFAAENSVVSPPTLRIVNGQLFWDDMGDGLGNLEAADSIEGPWTPIPGGPGTPIGTGGSMKFYRVAVPLTE
ncbi:MAG TPA: LamG domain-containing protein, partial [Verrucomicrobiae bacterium]